MTERLFFASGVKPGEAIILTDDVTAEQVAAKLSDSLPVKGTSKALDAELETIHRSGSVLDLGPFFLEIQISGEINSWGKPCINILLAWLGTLNSV